MIVDVKVIYIYVFITILPECVMMFVASGSETTGYSGYWPWPYCMILSPPGGVGPHGVRYHKLNLLIPVFNILCVRKLFL